MEFASFRYWLFTWTCYGQWLPGDRRGFVGNVRQEDGTRAIHNRFGTPCDADMPGLEQWARQRMADRAVTLSREDAGTVLAQVRETAGVKGWPIMAASVMFNHAHIVVGIGGGEDSRPALMVVKAWATRALKKSRPVPAGGSFWTAKGSRRWLRDARAVREAVAYVADKQPNPLAVWRGDGM